MRPTLPILALLACAGLASAQSVQRCRINGSIEYRDRACPDGAGELLAVPRAPILDAAGQRQLAREKALLASLLKERAAREAKDAQLQARASKTAETRRQRCAKIELEKKWADEDAAAAPARSHEQLRRKARRKGDLVQLECPP